MNRRQTIPKHLRLTINDFNSRFPDDDACLEAIKEMRFPDGYADCEKCQKQRKHHRVTGRPAYACDYCGSMISPMAGTIFEKSSTSLRLWFYAMYLMASTRCGISAGFMGNESQWRKFGPLWIEAKGPKQYIHSKDLRWKHERTQQLLERLGPIAREAGVEPVFGVARVSDFADLVPEYMRTRFKGYLLATYAAILGVLKIRDFSDYLEFTMEAQNEYELNARQIFALFDLARVPGKLKVAFVRKRDCMLLEPADCLSYCITQALRDFDSRKTTLCAPILGDGRGFGEHLNCERAKKLAAELIHWVETGRIPLSNHPE